MWSGIFNLTPDKSNHCNIKPEMRNLTYDLMREIKFDYIIRAVRFFS